MNFLTEDHFNTAMQSPKAATEVIRMLMDDLAICLAILGGPNATEEVYQQLIYRMRLDLLTGAIVAKKQLDEHLSGKSVFKPKLPH